MARSMAARLRKYSVSFQDIRRPQSKAATRNLPTTSLGRTNLVKGPRLLRTIDPHQQVEPVIRLSARTSVPRFYFHLRNDLDVPDDEGKDLPDLEAALELAASEARKLAGEIVKENGRITLSHRIDIEDDQHKLLASVSVRDVVRVES